MTDLFSTLGTVVAMLSVLGGMLWLFSAFYLRGPDLSRFDGPGGQRFSTGPAPNAEHRAVMAVLAALFQTIKAMPHAQRLAAMRHAMDTLFAKRVHAVEFKPVDAGGVPAEWVMAPGADPARRVLYLHGGAFMMGSPTSHRNLTSRFAEMTGGAVLAIDYRLMPEHPRRAGIEDCRTAYRWLLDHGPDMAGPASRVVVAGDSAGGNLALSLLAWVRDQGLREPDAAVALSPFTDASLGSPSLLGNIPTDPMLGPLFGPMSRIPRLVLLWFGWLQNRMRPCDPAISPLHGSLSGLPPLLVQASECEMLVDDSRRYVNRAQAEGSPASLQTWDHVVHVWQVFNPELTEARQALDEIARFLERHGCSATS